MNNTLLSLWHIHASMLAFLKKKAEEEYGIGGLGLVVSRLCSLPSASRLTRSPTPCTSQGHYVLYVVLSLNLPPPSSQPRPEKEANIDEYVAARLYAIVQEI